MSIFAFSSIFSFGLGSVFGGLIATSPHLGWRWVQWVHSMFVQKAASIGVFLLTLSLRFTGAIVLGVILVLTETRSSIILSRIVKDIRKTTGDPRYRTSAEIGKPDMLSLIKTSCTRPLCTHIFFSRVSFLTLFATPDLLLTEPIVQSFSVSGLPYVPWMTLNVI